MSGKTETAIVPTGFYQRERTLPGVGTTMLESEPISKIRALVAPSDTKIHKIQPRGVLPLVEMSLSHLGEDSTLPQEPCSLFSVDALQKALTRFCSSARYINRGNPYISSCVWDTSLDLPHIHIAMQLHFLNTNSDVQRRVRQDLLLFSEYLSAILNLEDFALSATLD